MTDTLIKTERVPSSPRARPTGAIRCKCPVPVQQGRIVSPTCIFIQLHHFENTDKFCGCHQVQLFRPSTTLSYCRPCLYVWWFPHSYFENTDKFYDIWQNSDVKFKTENIIFYKSVNYPSLITIKCTEFDVCTLYSTLLAKRTVCVSIYKSVFCTFQFVR